LPRHCRFSQQQEDPQGSHAAGGSPDLHHYRRTLWRQGKRSVQQHHLGCRAAVLMRIRIYRGHQPPPNPEGATVVIDVIRAFTTAHYAFVGGAREIFLVATADAALSLKAKNPSLLLAGEIDALPIDG